MSRPARPARHGPGDADLLARVRAGDRAALDALYLHLCGPAFALARRVLGDDALAEDVLHEVFLQVWREPGAHDRGSVGAWVLGMVHHRAVEVVRREESRRRRHAGEGPAAGEGGLPEVQREALDLAYFGGYTQREVAALTRAPLGTVKARMLAGLRQLARDAGAARGGALHDVTSVDGPGR
ncbi:sigma factor [Geodermatophilus sp. CPCC 206100]|uniref:sigma factor n=1 Tax=Geodermatophilus sp. CPCC 206100 TaxID=3020054 RepID=UPI003AFF7BCC